MSNIFAYIAENLRLSIATWGVGSRMTSLLAAFIALGLAVFTLLGGAAAGVTLPGYQGSLPLLLGVWFLFLILIVTPYRMWLGQRHALAGKDEQIAGLQSRLAGNSATQELVSSLWRLRDEGVEIRNARFRAPSAQADFAAWMPRYEDWRNRTLAAAGALSPHLRSDLQVLDQMGPPPAGVNPINREHARAHAIISEITKRLAEYLRKNYP